MQLENVGHCLVYGQTYSGKTYFTKYLITQLEPENVYVFTTSKHEWQNYETYDNFENNIQTILNNCKAVKDTNSTKCNNLIIFDDFNSELNTTTDKVYNELFTGGRHKGIRVINLAQQAKAVGPTVRNNIRYAFIMATILEDELKKLADMVFNKEKFALKKVVASALQQSEYACVMIDVRSRRTSVHIAPVIKKSNVPKDHMPVTPRLTDDTVNNQEIIREVVPPPGSVMREDPGNAIFTGVASYDQMTNDTRMGENSQFGNKYVNGNMVDNSQNSFKIDYRIKNQQIVETNNINNQQRIEANRINNTISIENYSHEKKINNMRIIDEVENLINTPEHYLTEENKVLIARVFNATLKPTKKQFTKYTYKAGIPVFMDRICNRRVKFKQSNILNLAENAVDIYKADTLTAALNTVNLLKGFFS